MNENNANWHIIPGNLSFFPFLAFPRTGPSMSLANILRHLWELSHGDSLSAGGSPVSRMAALPAAAASRGQQRGGFFPTARKRWHSITVTPMSCFFLTAQSPHAIHISHGITHAHKHLCEDENHYPITSHKAKRVDDWRTCWRHGSPLPPARKQEDFKAHCWAVTGPFLVDEVLPMSKEDFQLVLLFRWCIPVFGCARGSSPEQLRATLIIEASSVQASKTKHVGRCWNVSFDFNIVETCWLVQYFIIWKVKWADRKYVL